jgi:hypothetical protein
VFPERDTACQITASAEFQVMSNAYRNRELTTFLQELMYVKKVVFRDHMIVGLIICQMDT